MDTRNARRVYTRPELVPQGRLEVETKGNPGPALESGMPLEIAF